MEKEWIVFDIETLGLDPIHEQVTTICAIDDNMEKFEMIAHTEKEEISVLSSFITWMLERPQKVLVSKNGKRFDVPYIIMRTVMSGFHDGLHKQIMIFKDRKHIDIQELTRKWISLEDMATLMRLGSSKTMTGLQAISIWRSANKLWEQGEKERAERLFSSIVDYCTRDCSLTMEIALRHKLIEVKA